MSPAPDLPETARAAVEEALRAGRKIDAIKLYRKASGVGLREAKEAVEQMEREGIAPSVGGEAVGHRPDRSAVRSSSGCAGLVVLAALSALWWLGL